MYIWIVGEREEGRHFSCVGSTCSGKVPLLSSRKIILASAVFMFFLSLSLVVQPTIAGSATVSTQVICSGIDKSQSNSWQPIGVTDTFSTADEAVYTFINLDVTPPVSIKVVWVAPHEFEFEGKSYATIANDPTKIEWKGSGFMYDLLSIAGSNYALPVGVWKVQVYADTTLLSTAQFKLQPSMDLVSKSITPGENEPIYPGDTVTITYELENTGKTTLRAVDVVLGTPLPQDVTLVEAASPKDLAPGATEEFTVKVKFDKEGTYNFTNQLYINEALIEEFPVEALVSPAPFSWTLIIVGIVGVAVVVLIAVLLMRRRKPSRPAVPPMPYVPPQPSPVISQATKYCTSCGSQISQEVRYCTKCGASQS